MAPLSRCEILPSLPYSPILEPELDGGECANIAKMEIDDDDYETEERAPYNGKEESHCLPEETLRMFTHLLKQSARLYSVVVRFHRQFYVELCSWIDERHHWRFRHNVIKQVMSALLSAPDRLPRELAIQNLHNINVEDPDAAEMIARVLGGGLQSLRLNITNEHRESNGEVDFQVSFHTVDSQSEISY